MSDSLPSPSRLRPVLIPEEWTASSDEEQEAGEVIGTISTPTRFISRSRLTNRRSPSTPAGSLQLV